MGTWTTEGTHPAVPGVVVRGTATIEWLEGELRKTRSLTLKQMARRTNLSVSLLSQIERAESSASVSSLFKVATALDVPLTDLFAGY